MQIIDQTNSSLIDGTNSIEKRVSIYQNSRWLVILPDLSRLLKIQRTITERVIDPLTWIDHVLGRLYAGVYGSQGKPGSDVCGRMPFGEISRTTRQATTSTIINELYDRAARIDVLDVSWWSSLAFFAVADRDSP